MPVQKANFKGFSAPGIAVDHSQSGQQAIHDQAQRSRGGVARHAHDPFPDDNPGMTLQNAYAGRMNRNTPVYGQGAVAGPVSPIGVPPDPGYGIKGAIMRSKLGIDPNIINLGGKSDEEIQAAGAQRKNWMDLATNQDVTPGDFEKMIGDYQKQAAQQIDMQHKQTALAAITPHLSPEHAGLFQQMASDPSVSANDFYNHAITATNPKAGKQADPLGDAKKYGEDAKLLDEMGQANVKGMDPTRRMVYQNAQNDLMSVMNKQHEQIVPPQAAAPAPAPAMTMPGQAAQPQFKVGQTIPAAGKQYTVTGVDPDGHPRVREFVPPAQALPNAAPASAQ